MDPAIVRFSAPSAEGETKTHAGSIGAALLERTKEPVCLDRHVFDERHGQSDAKAFASNVAAAVNVTLIQ